MSLASGERLHIYQWYMLPISIEVINRAHEIATKEGQPAVKGNFEFHNVLDHQDDVTDNDNESNNYNTYHDNEMDETRITIYNNNDSEIYESDYLDRVHHIDANGDDSVKLIKSEME